MVAALMIVAVLAQSGGMRAGRAGTAPRAAAPAAVEGVTNPPGTSVEIVTYAIFENGDKRETGTFMVDAVSGRYETHVYVPNTVCERPQMSGAIPAQATHGWQITVAPTRRGIAKDVHAAVVVGYRRMWHEGLREHPANGYQLLQLGPARYRSAATLDQLSGNPRLMQAWADRTASAAREPKLLAPTAACQAVDMAIEVRLAQPVFEAELWLVHQPPAGRETAQRQVVRIKGGTSGAFFFDHVEVRPAESPLTLRISGNLDPSHRTEDKLDARLTLRCVFDAGTSAPIRYLYVPVEMNTSEVVSFRMPDKFTELPGHRLSVRLKMRAL